jgi:hypothetical protein
MTGWSTRIEGAGTNDAPQMTARMTASMKE